VALWDAPLALQEAGTRQLFARELVSGLRAIGAATTAEMYDARLTLLKVPAERDELQQVIEAARRYGWVEPGAGPDAATPQWAVTEAGQAVQPPESLEVHQVVTRVGRLAGPARRSAVDWLPLLAVIVGALAATQEANDSSTSATLTSLRVASIAILALALLRGLVGELRILRAAVAFRRVQEDAFYRPVKAFFSPARLRWVAAFDLALLAAFGWAIFLSWWAVVPAAFAVVAYALVEHRWRIAARRVMWRRPAEGAAEGARPWLTRGLRVLVGRVLPIAAAAGGVAVIGLALLTSILTGSVNRTPLDEVLLLPRLWVAIVIGVIAVGVTAFVQLRVRRDAELHYKPRRDLWVGVAIGAGLVAAALALIAALVLAAWLRSLFGHRGDIPQSETSAYVTLGIIAVVVAATVSAVMWLSLRLIAGVHGAQRDVVPVASLTAILVLGALLTMVREPPKTVEALAARTALSDVAARLGDPAVRYDVMLVVDPSDPAASGLLALARTNPALLLAPRTDSVPTNTAFGVAAVAPDADRWRLLLNPTTNRKRVVAALARITPTSGPASYGEALLTLGTTRATRWRRGSVRALTVVAARPPARSQLPVEGLPEPANRFEPPAVISALIPPEPPPANRALAGGAIVLDLVAAGGPRPLLRRWRDWTRLTGGGVRPAGAQGTLLDDAEDALARNPSEAELKLATDRRPLLLFDRGEKHPPLDVDRFLAEVGADGEPAHELCELEAFEYQCDGVASGQRLAHELRSSDSVIQIDANPAPSTVTDEFVRDAAQRIYYRLTRDPDGRRLYLDYWIFYRFNDSPTLPRLNCLSGLAVAEGTCFDHEGDWEGVTVTLERDDQGAFQPESVTYAGHAWRWAFGWDALAARGATKGGHPVVWVARGSHASYPAPCPTPRNDCQQLGLDLPDGHRNGERPWAYNDDNACEQAHCVLRLPLTRARGPASWGAFGGHWGRPRCTRGLKLCVRAFGPDSPFFQRRYQSPGTAPSFR
jgi:hypothetical protein